MPKKRRTEIADRLSALNPSEPTRTRSKAARKSSAEKLPLKEGFPPQDAQPASEPQRDIPSRGIVMYSMPGETAEIYRAAYESWFQIARDCNRMFLSSLADFMDPGRWRRS